MLAEKWLTLIRLMLPTRKKHLKVLYAMRKQLLLLKTQVQ